jgi:hypothetical protein
MKSAMRQDYKIIFIAFLRFNSVYAHHTTNRHNNIMMGQPAQRIHSLSTVAGSRLYGRLYTQPFTSNELRIYERILPWLLHACMPKMHLLRR